jgi:uncharacterized protein YyaL (SSP411 family)
VSPYVEKAFRHLETHWDREGGGYFGRGGIAGDWVGGPDKYTDDNALAGLALLAAHDSAPTADLRVQYRTRAVAVGRYLAGGALWDRVFGGGFWWNTHRGDTAEGKPTQSNGLAAVLFLRLYGLTADERWRHWAARTMAWLEGQLYDPGASLYWYSVRYLDLTVRRGATVETRYFNYDQGILIEAWTLRARQDDDRAALRRARDIAAAAQTGFWDEDLGGYVLEMGTPQVFAAYGAWLTPSLLALAAADHDPRWYALARGNVDALHARLYDPRDGGYAHRAWRENGRVRVDPERHTAAQAWLEYAQAALARF